MGEFIELVEIDIPRCSLTYGTAPCTASVGVTGPIKCFNTLRTCQDRENFAREVFTLRLCHPTTDLPYDAIPNLESVDLTPPKLDPGNSMGMRASVKVSCSEHPSADAQFDKYVAERGYNPFLRGTFWAKLRARVPSMEGYPLRVLRGTIGQPLEEMYTEHYFITTSGVDASGITIQAKDALSFTDAKKSQCPVPTTGRLTADATGSFSTFTLQPSGIGDLEYEASGFVCLSNKEVIEYTRSGDTFTVVTRAAFGSQEQDHKEDAAAQQVKVYDGEGAADIIYDLLVNFTAGVDAGMCDLPTWQTEADTYIGHLYTTAITAPTEVNTLCNELLSQAGAYIWWDPAAQQVRFRSLRPVSPSARTLDDDVLLSGLVASEQASKRVSQALTYYALADYTNKVDKEDNLRATVLSVDPEADFDYDGLPAYTKVLSRWITIDNRAAAERINNMRLSRYRDPPRAFKFSLWNAGTLPILGEGVNISPRSIQDTTGAPAVIPALITSREVTADVVDYEAEELQFSDSLVPEGDRNVFIDTDHFNLDLRELYDSLYSAIPSGGTITFYLSPGAWIGSTSPGSPALDVGAWPEAGVTVDLFLVIAQPANTDANVLGAGGRGGGYPGLFVGEDGGVAIYTRVPISITNNGIIGGGGGGGEPYVQIGGPDDGQSGGGGGAGFNGYDAFGNRMGAVGGLGGDPGIAGTPQVGGDGGIHGGVGTANKAGDGGDLGQGGAQKTADGAAFDYSDPGAAVDGDSYITWLTLGDVRGSRIN